MSDSHPSPQLMAFLFSDLVDSTGWKQELGDVAYAADVLRPHNALFRDLLAAHGGTERTFTGDGFLATFAAPSDAVRFALRLHAALADRPWGPAVERTGRGPQTRVGIHLGEALAYADGDPGPRQVTGHAVDLAARIMGLAGGGQTLLTRHAFDSARQNVRDDGLSWQDYGQFRCKGGDDPVGVCEVGVAGRAPLAAPADSDKARRVRVDAADDTGPWRPAVGQPIPRRTGWRVEAHLGTGGFGEVWLARHDRTKEARVFKFCFDADRLRSFKRELTFFKLIRGELGDRADIAKLYEINVDAPPYFLEGEYVAAGNLARWAEARGGLTGIPLDTRLDLVARVARAVAAAHSLGIIHKDLKPSNVLIRADGRGGPQPQLSDFGIGELADRSRLQEAAVTETGFTESVLPGSDPSRTGTRLYAPPESQVGKPATTGADVYALGVMLFQMVVGDLHRPLGTGWQEAVTAEAVGDPVLADLLREDITTATRADPDARLAGAALLAERLERRADRRQDRLTAHRQAEAERLAAERGLRVRRLRRLLAASLLGLIGVGALGAYAWRLKGRADTEAANARAATTRAEGEADRANAATAQAEQAAADATRQARRAERTADFLRRLFNTNDPTGFCGAGLLPTGAGGQKVTAAELLRSGAEKVRTEFRDDDFFRAALLDMIGDVMRSIGLLEDAKSLLDEGRKLRVDLGFGPDHPDVILSLRHMALWHMENGDVWEAIDFLNQILDSHRRKGTLDSLDAAEVKLFLAGQLALASDPAAERYAREVLEIRQKLLPPGRRDIAVAKAALAGCLFDQDRWAEALPLLADYRRFLQAELKLHQTDLPLQAVVEYQESLVHRKADRWSEAEARVRRAIRLMNDAMGRDNHVYNCIMLYDLGLLLYEQGKADEAEDTFRKCAELVHQTVHEGYPRAHLLWSAYGELLCDRHKARVATDLWDNALADHDARYGTNNRFRLSFLAGAGRCHARAGNLPRAEGLARQLVDQLTRTPVRLTGTELAGLGGLVQSLVPQGDLNLIRELCRFGLTPEARTAHPLEYLFLSENWAEALVTRHRYHEAEEPLADAGRLSDQAKLTGQDVDTVRAGLHFVRGKAFWGLGRHDDAARELRSAVETAERTRARGAPDRPRARLLALQAARDQWSEVAAAAARAKRSPGLAEPDQGLMVYLEVAAHRLDPTIEGPVPTLDSADNLTNAEAVAYRARAAALLNATYLAVEVQQLADGPDRKPASGHVRLARAICYLKLDKPEEAERELAGLALSKQDNPRDRLVEALRALARFRQRPTDETRRALTAARDRATAFLKGTGAGTDPELSAYAVSLQLELRLLVRQIDAELAKK